MAIDNQYNGGVIDGTMKCHKREITVCTQSSPTDKSEAHLEAACRDMHQQVYQEVQPTSQKNAKRQVYQVDQGSTKPT